MKRLSAQVSIIVVLLTIVVSAAGAADRSKPVEGGQLLAVAVAALVIAVLGAFIVAAFLSVVRFLFPAKVEEANRTVKRSPGLTFFTGLLSAAVAVALMALVSAVPASGAGVVLRVILGMVIVVVGLMAIVGLAASVVRLGDAVARMGGREGASDLARLSMGSACAVLAAFALYVGWALLGYLVLQGLGGVLLSFFRGPEVQPSHPEAA